jgi:transketolase
MKKAFFDALFKLMSTNKDIYLILVGLGYPRVDEFLKAYPDRAINSEASEQTALDIAVGLAYKGKIPIIYTITPFFYRGWETIRTYINHENLNVKLIGAGRNDDYSKEDGYTHDATDMKWILATQGNIQQFYPEDIEEMKELLIEMIKIKKPHFLSLTR